MSGTRTLDLRRISVCCLLILAAAALAPQTAMAAFTPSTQDTLTYVQSFASGSEAFPEALALGPGGSVFYTHSDLNRPLEGYPYDPSNYVVGVTADDVEFFRVGNIDNSEFQRSAGIDLTSDGMLVVADTEHNRIRVLDTATGESVYTYGESDLGDAQFAAPKGIAVGPDDTLWIADTFHNKIQHLSLWGGFIGEFPLQGGSQDLPDGIALDADGNIWIAIPNQDKIQKYSPEGEVLLTIDQWQEVDAEGNPTQTGTFDAPRGLGVDPWGVVYVGDSGNSRIVRLSSTGTWLGSLNPSGVLQSVSDVDIDAFGNVYAADPVSDALYRFNFVMAGEDGEPPITASNIPSGWRNAPLLVTLTAVDNANAILGTWYSTDGSYPTTPYTGPFLIADEGDTIVRFYSVDEAQNFEPVKTRHVKLDFGDPTTTSDAQSTYAGVAVVTFTATDTVSGVAKTEYSRDGGSWKVGNVFTSSTGGTHSLRFRSVDAAGNVEDFQEVTYTLTPRVDQSEAGVYYDGTWTQYYSSSRHNYYWLATNTPGSFAEFRFIGTGFNLLGSTGPSYGIASVTIDGGEPLSADFYAPSTLHKQSVLNVSGLESAEHVVRIAWSGERNPLSSGTTIGLDAFDLSGELLPDEEPPFTMVMAEQEWSNAPVEVTLAPTDEGSWVRNTYYRVNGGTSVEYTQPILVQDDGIHTITFWSVDAAGNVEIPTTITIYIDMTLPVTTSNISPDWTADDVEVVLTATDNLTGVNQTSYSTDGSFPTEAYEGEPFVVTEEGVTTVQYFSVDGLSNEELVKTEYVRIDRTPPTASANPSQQWVSGSAVVDLIGEDSLSGVAYFNYWIDGVAQGSTTGQVSVPGSGVRVLEYQPVDHAGNSGETYSAQVLVDNTPPESSVTVAGPFYRTASIDISAEDPLSGVSHTEYRIDGGDWITGGTAVSTDGGQHTLEYRSVDAVGNVEQAKSTTFSVIARYEDDDPRVAYEGAWSKAANASRSGGSWAYANSAGAKAVVKFTGTSIDFYGGTAPNYGKVLLSVDGSPMQTVDMYSSGYTHNRKLGSISGLAAGPHTLTVEWTGTKNPASTGTGIGLDALDMNASLQQPLARYEETHPFMTWYGNWVSSENTKRSAGAWVYTNSADSEVNVAFTGTGVDFYGSTAPNYGMAQVKIDGVPVQTVDFYTTGYIHNHLLFSARGLEYGPHTLTLTWTGTKHVSSTGTGIGFDAVDVIGGIKQAAPAGPAITRHEETDARIVWDGTWNAASHATRSAGKWKYTNTAGSAAHVAFTGSRVDIVGSTAPNYGKALVTIDGTAQYWADFYTSGYIHNRKVLSITGLADGPHTMSIEWTGTKHSASTGTGIGLDAVDVIGTLSQAVLPGYPVVRYEETASAIQKTGTWVTSVAAKRSAGSWLYTNTSDSAAEFTFSGTRVELRASLAPNYGIARVVLDGTPYLMDLYSSGYIHNALGWSSGKLPDGIHTLRIEWTGTKNAASAGTGIGMDAVDIQGVLQ